MKKQVLALFGDSDKDTCVSEAVDLFIALCIHHGAAKEITDKWSQYQGGTTTLDEAADMEQLIYTVMDMIIADIQQGVELNIVILQGLKTYLSTDIGEFVYNTLSPVAQAYVDDAIATGLSVEQHKIKLANLQEQLKIHKLRYHELESINPGAYVVIEGPDNVGKSTLIKTLEAKFIGEGYTVLVVREPGSTPEAEAMRDVLKTRTLDSTSEFYLMHAARNELTKSVIVPVLRTKTIIISDRNVLSSVAYQTILGQSEVSGDIITATKNKAFVIPHYTAWCLPSTSDYNDHLNALSVDAADVLEARYPPMEVHRAYQWMWDNMVVGANEYTYVTSANDYSSRNRRFEKVDKVNNARLIYTDIVEDIIPALDAEYRSRLTKGKEVIAYVESSIKSAEEVIEQLEE